MDQGVKDQPFTDEQKSYLEGFFAGGDLGRTMRSLPTFASALGLKPEQLPGNGRLLNEQDGAAAVPTGPEAIHYFAQDRQVAEGKKLTPEELVRRHCVEQLRELSAAGALAAA